MWKLVFDDVKQNGGDLDAICSRVQGALTFSVPLYTGGTKKLEFFRRDEDGITVPRFFAMEHLAPFVSPERWICPSPGSRLEAGLVMSCSLRDTPESPQKRAHDACVEKLKRLGGATLVLPCGVGKTNVAIAVALSLGVQTMVLSHKKFLLQQWEERLRSVVSGDFRIGYVVQKRCEAEADFVLASLQTLSRWEGRRDRKGKISCGLLIVDEAHHIAAPTFAKALHCIEASYSLALTATPTRKDNLQKVMFWMLGSVAFQLQYTDLRHVVAVSISDASAPPVPLFMRKDAVDFNRTVSFLTRDTKRNLLISKAALCLKEQGRRGLLLTDRVAHVHALCALLGECSTAVVGGHLVDEATFSKPLTVSTYQYFSEGVDFPGSFVLLCSPKSDVEQCVGRVLRGQARPVVVDFTDRNPLLDKMEKKRNRLYQKSGFTCIRGGVQVLKSL